MAYLEAEAEEILLVVANRGRARPEAVITAKAETTFLERGDPQARGMLSFLPLGSPRTEGHMPVTIRRRELIVTLGKNCTLCQTAGRQSILQQMLTSDRMLSVSGAHAPRIEKGNSQ